MHLRHKEVPVGTLGYSGRVPQRVLRNVLSVLWSLSCEQNHILSEFETIIPYLEMKKAHSLPLCHLNQCRRELILLNDGDTKAQATGTPFTRTH